MGRPPFDRVETSPTRDPAVRPVAAYLDIEPVYDPVIPDAVAAATVGVVHDGPVQLPDQTDRLVGPVVPEHPAIYEPVVVEPVLAPHAVDPTYPVAIAVPYEPSDSLQLRAEGLVYSLAEPFSEVTLARGLGPAGDVALRTDRLEADFSGGVAGSATKRFDGGGWLGGFDVRGFWAGGLDSSAEGFGIATEVASGSVGLGGVLADGTADLYGVEGNVFVPVSPWTDLVFGVRGVGFDEELDVTAVGEFGVATAGSEVENRLFGGQFGVAHALYDAGGAFTVDGTATFGGLANWSDLVASRGGLAGDAGAARSRTGGTFFTEVGADGRFAVTRSTAVSAGVRMLYFDRVERAFAAFPDPVTLGGEREGLLAYGVEFGLERVW